MFTHCTTHFMAPIMLSKYHNFTMQLFDSSKSKYINKFEVANYESSVPVIVSNMFYENYNFNLKVVQSYYKMYRFEWSLLLYCPRRQNYSSFNGIKLWFSPFDFPTWMLIITSNGINLVLQLYFKLIESVPDLTKNLSFTRQLLKLIAWWTLYCGLFLSWFQENDFLSMVTVVMPIQPIETIKELLNQGYKIFSSKWIRQETRATFNDGFWNPENSKSKRKQIILLVLM